MHAPLKGILAGFAGANPDHLLQIEDKNLPVAHFAGGGGLFNCSQRLVELVITHGDVDPGFWQKIDRIFRPPIDFGVALLPAKSLDFGHGDARHARNSGIGRGGA